ncbi:sensor histidine kinase [Kushneria marisflavi]|uniref:histidine kinase n=1 Tax=Kushneria marisflavi TaxID=157779 RepID=A0A240UMN9_9GAMM|nr:HAMP domain-containing sensor histidine kinase [Kushneria marisflavi]ART62289.1 two-component sensor histidine kinase [Kushneria marisflavi]RKD87390.1 two-component system sensor histidine kinase GlrK [Kushneria marisflavi]
MASRIKRRWRPRSLLQQVLTAFLLVMLPIGVLIHLAGQSFSQLSELADVSAREAVDETRRARQLTNLSTDMERSARQYAVLDDQSLLEIYGERRARYSDLLNEHAAFMGDSPLIQSLRRQLTVLETLPTPGENSLSAQLSEFSRFTASTEALAEATRRQVDARIDEIRAQASQVTTRLWQATLALVSFSLVLILFFTWRIIRPIRQLEQRILGIGGSGDTEETRPIQGPLELVNLEERLEWLSARLKELEEQKQQFLRHMSHELKTPLASIREGSGLLADGVVGEMSQRQREIVLLIDESGQELQTLIEQLLDYNLLQQNRRLNVTRFDVASVIHEVLSKHRLALQQKGMVVEERRAPLYWQADRARTARILDNLVSNAIAYGDDEGRLYISASADQQHLTLDVANSGQPINERDRDHLFEPFYQGSSQRKGPLKGSGIGLSVAAESARAQHGTLSLIEDSINGCEVCFELVLPWIVEESSQDNPSLPRAAREKAALARI